MDGAGNFSQILTNVDPSFIKINSGTLTDTVTRQGTVSVNISGWHANWNYQSLTQMITQAQQVISTDDRGAVTIDTNFTLDQSKKRQRNGETLYTDLLLGFIGQSKGNVQFDKQTQRYLVDSITNMNARYQLDIGDTDTKAQELTQYLSFAPQFGLATSTNCGRR